MFALARRINVEHGGRIGVGEELHGVLQEVPLQGGIGRADEDVGVEGGDEAEFLARFVFAAVRRAKTGEVGILTDEAGGRGLAAGVGVGTGIQHQHLDRRVAGKDARERAKADVVGRAVATYRDHGRQQGQFFLGELVPREEAEGLVVLFRHVGVVEFKTGHAQGADVADGLRRDAFEHPLGQRLGVLEQAVDPRIVVGVEREGRGINAAATRRVGDYCAGGAVAGRAAFVEVEAFFQRGDDLADALGAGAFLLAETGLLGFQRGQQPFQFLDMRVAALVGDGAVGRHHQTDRGDFAAATAAAVSTGCCVVVAAVEHQALGFTASVQCAIGEACRGVRRLAHEFEARLQGFQQGGVLIHGCQRAGAADIDTFETAGALPRVDIGGEQTTGAGGALFHGIEEGPRPGYRVSGQHIDQLAQVGQQGRLLGRQT